MVIDPVLAEAGGTSAGISLRLPEDASDLRQKLEEASGISLREQTSARGGDRRVSERSGSDADIRIDCSEGRFWGVTANISYEGVLALLWRAMIPVGTAVRAVLSNPAVELELPVDGKIVHRTRCSYRATLAWTLEAVQVKSHVTVTWNFTRVSEDVPQIAFRHLREQLEYQGHQLPVQKDRVAESLRRVPYREGIVARVPNRCVEVIPLRTLPRGTTR